MWWSEVKRSAVQMSARKRLAMGWPLLSLASVALGFSTKEYYGVDAELSSTVSAA